MLDSYVNIEDPQNVINFLERNLKIVRGLEDRAMEAEVYCYLGIAYHKRGDFRKAKEYFEQHLKISKAMEDKAREGEAYGNLGHAYYSFGDFQKA